LSVREVDGEMVGRPPENPAKSPDKYFSRVDKSNFKSR